MMTRYSDLTHEQKALMPNLFIVGAAKCGTSSLHDFLGRHPDIKASDPKEPCFFIDQADLRKAWPVRALARESHDLEAYLRLFDGPVPVRYRLESSAHYAQFPRFKDVPERIAAASPDARIILMVRNPMDRAISYYWQEHRELQESLPLERAIDENPLYVDTSNYTMQYLRFAACFRQIKVISADRLRIDRRGVLGEICDWLGIAAPTEAMLTASDRHKTGSWSREPRFGFARTVRDSPAWQSLRSRLPEAIVRAAGQIAVREVAVASESELDIRLKLSAIFRSQVAELDSLIGENFYDQWFSRPDARDDSNLPKHVVKDILPQD